MKETCFTVVVPSCYADAEEEDDISNITITTKYS